MLKYSTIAAVFRRLNYDWSSSLDFWVNNKLTHYFQINGCSMDFKSAEEVDLAISEIAGVLDCLKLQYKIMRISFTEKGFFIALWVIIGE